MQHLRRMQHLLPMGARAFGSAADAPHAALTTSVRELLRIRDADIGGQRVALDAASLQSTVRAGDAIDTLIDNSVSGMVVLRDKAVVGLVTERDLLKYVGSRDSPVEEAMIAIADAHCVTPSDSVKVCIDLCMDKRVGHLPVVTQDGQLYGLVYLRDLVPFQASYGTAALLEHDTEVIVDDYSFSLTAEEGERLKAQLGRAIADKDAAPSWTSWFGGGNQR